MLMKSLFVVLMDHSVDQLQFEVLIKSSIFQFLLTLLLLLHFSFSSSFSTSSPPPILVSSTFYSLASPLFFLSYFSSSSVPHPLLCDAQVLAPPTVATLIQYYGM